LRQLVPQKARVTRRMYYGFSFVFVKSLVLHYIAKELDLVDAGVYVY
jgi:hypothetical protein